MLHNFTQASSVNILVEKFTSVSGGKLTVNFFLYDEAKCEIAWIYEIIFLF